MLVAGPSESLASKTTIRRRRQVIKGLLNEGEKMKERRPAESFPPGDFIKDELDERGWTQDDLAEIMGRPLPLVNQLVTGKRGITPETAKGLGEAFDTGAQFWLNLQSAYQLFRNDALVENVGRRSRLYGIAPVRLMVKRNWIEASTNIEVLEQRLREFFGTPDLEKIPSLPCMARRGNAGDLTPAQKAWLFRAKNLARAVHAERYSKRRLGDAIAQLKTMLASEADIRKVPKTLAGAGIKFLVIEPLPQSKIDGISLWIDGTPVIALSLRYDRIDSFWHTLIHELGHIKNEDGLKDSRIVVDTDLFDESDGNKPIHEQLADDFAVSLLVPQDELDNFVARTYPLFSRAKISGFANRIRVHPGIVLGQIHHRYNNYSLGREMLVKVRHLIISSALTDGYGQTLPANLN